MRSPIYLFAALSASALSGCYAARDEARARAAGEFQCPTYALHVTDDGDGTYRVEGCGQSAVFACTAPPDARRSLFYGNTTNCMREGDIDVDGPVMVVAERPRPGGFDAAAVRRDIAPQIDAAVEACRSRRGPHGMADVKLAFAATGRVTSLSLDSRFDGTDAAACLSRELRAIQIAPFHGDTETIEVDLDIPGAGSATATR